MNLPSVAVITPTTNHDCLVDAYESVKNQDYKGPLTHYIVYDGEESAANKADWKDPHLEIWTIPKATGMAGHLGHRIYAAMTFLIHDADYLVFLDEDNFFDANHISSLVASIEETQATWAFSLRKIINQDKSFICEDNCESLGPFVNYHEARGSEIKLIDVNCYMLPRSLAIEAAPLWERKAQDSILLDIDRTLAMILIQGFPCSCTGEYTVNYRLGSRKSSAAEIFFLEGNEYMRSKYGNEEKFPWKIK
jgi:hypothetical protein